MAPNGSDGSFQAGPPRHPFDEKWYVRADGETLGPYDGRRVKEMIEQARLAADSPVAKVGATQWSAIRDIPVFAALLPPAPPPSVVGSPSGQSPVAEKGGPRYAGFWIRLLAYIIDLIIVNLVAVGVGLVVGHLIRVVATANGIHNSEQISAIASAIGAVVGLAIVLVYYIVFNSGRWQGTPGKRVLGIHLVTVGGEKVGGWLAFGRYLAYIVSSLPLFIGFMVIGWNSEKKGFHDMICDTRVIYGKL
jgi:uncharacterized RDD family membrane protein YckC